MSKYFAWLDGDDTPYDFEFKKFVHGYKFYLGDVCICQLSKTTIRSKTTWNCIVLGLLHEDVPKLVNGFATRHAAIDYALKTHSRTKGRYNK